MERCLANKGFSVDIRLPSQQAMLCCCCSTRANSISMEFTPVTLSFIVSTTLKKVRVQISPCRGSEKVNSE